MMQTKSIHFILLVAFLMIGLSMSPVISEAQIVDGEQIVRASLLSEQSDFSQPFYVAIQFDLSPEWYLYWINPGDSGLPIEVTWELPQGFEAGPVLYPFPEKYGSSESISYGFKRQLLLLCEIRPKGIIPRDVTVPLRASLDWLVCKESCVRGMAEVAIDLKAVPTDRRLTKEMIASANARLPRNFSSLDRVAATSRIDRKGQSVTVTLHFSGNDRLAVSDFYPEVIDEFTIEHSGISIANNRVTIPLTAQTRESTLTRVRGIVMIEREAYQIDIQVAE